MTASSRGKRTAVQVTRKYSQVKEGSTKIQLVVTDEEKEMIRRTARREGVTMSAIMRRAFRYYCPVDIQRATIGDE